MSVVRTCPLNIVMLSLAIVSARSMLACSVASTSCTSKEVCMCFFKQTSGYMYWVCVGWVYMYTYLSIHICCL